MLLHSRLTQHRHVTLHHLWPIGERGENTCTCTCVVIEQPVSPYKVIFPPLLHVCNQATITWQTDMSSNSFCTLTHRLVADELATQRSDSVGHKPLHSVLKFGDFLYWSSGVAPSSIGLLQLVTLSQSLRVNVEMGFVFSGHSLLSERFKCHWKHLRPCF